MYVCPSRPKNSEAIFWSGERASVRAKHAVSFQIIKYIIQKNITTSWAPKYSVTNDETNNQLEKKLQSYRTSNFNSNTVINGTTN
jgi:hypothetical protein